MRSAWELGSMRYYWMGRRHTSEVQRPHHSKQAFVASSEVDTRAMLAQGCVEQCVRRAACV